MFHQPPRDPLRPEAGLLSPFQAGGWDGCNQTSVTQHLASAPDPVGGNPQGCSGTLHALVQPRHHGPGASEQPPPSEPQVHGGADQAVCWWEVTGPNLLYEMVLQIKGTLSADGHADTEPNCLIPSCLWQQYNYRSHMVSLTSIEASVYRLQLYSHPSL